MANKAFFIAEYYKIKLLECKNISSVIIIDVLTVVVRYLGMYICFQLTVLKIFLASSVGTQIDADRVVSRLRIQGATNKDTGNYTCRLGDNAFDFPRGRVKVHVVDGN